MTVARKPPLALMIEELIKNQLANVHVAIPAQVVAYNATDTPQTVDVRPVADRTLIEEDREATDVFPVIYSVPLMFPGSGSYRLTFPIAVNDYVLLVFADRSTDEFISKGGITVPQDLRTHHIADAFAIPGVTPGPNALTNVVTSAMVIGKNGNTPQKAARQNDGVTIGQNATPGSPLVLPCVALVQGATSIQITAPITDAKITGGSNDVEIT